MNRNYWDNYLLVLGSARSRLPAIVALMLFSAILDVVGLGLIAPMIAILFGRESGITTIFGLDASLYASEPSAIWVFLALAVAVMVAFAAKGITAYRMQRAIISFSENHIGGT